MRAHHRVIVLIAAAALAISVSAQATNPPSNAIPAGPPAPGPTDQLLPLDQAVEDTGPLSASPRRQQDSLREPVGFEQVYQVPGREDLLMRSSGGIIAIFPRSFYAASSRGGVRPIIPAGTVFHIGPPILLGVPAPIDESVVEKSSLSRDELARENSRVRSRLGEEFDDRSESRFETAMKDVDAVLTEEQLAALFEVQQNQPTPKKNVDLPPAQPGATTGRGPAIVSDDAYRAARLEQLLTRAARRQP